MGDKWPYSEMIRGVGFLENIFSREYFSGALVKQSRGRELAGKEVINMNKIKSLMSVVFLTGALGLSALSAGAESVISQDG